MTSQASPIVAPNELNTIEIGCSADAKLFHPQLPTVMRIMGIPEELQDSNKFLARGTSQGSKTCDTSPKSHIEISNKALASTPKECGMSTSHMLDKAAEFAQLFSKSSFHKKRHLDQRDPVLPASKRVRNVGHEENGNPSLPPRRVRYQRRNSFVLPNSRGISSRRCNGCHGSIESSTNELPLQENGNLAFSPRNE